MRQSSHYSLCSLPYHHLPCLRFNRRRPVLRNQRKIKSEFGRDFTLNFTDVELDKWIGPIESPFGHHIIYVTNYTEGYIPDITNVLKQVEVDLLQDKRDKALKEYLNDIKSEYTIYINPELQI